MSFLGKSSSTNNTSALYQAIPKAESSTKISGKTKENSNNDFVQEKKPELSIWQLMVVLRPYFWPNAGSDGAIINRIRAMSTWIFVGASKAASLISPFYIANAANDLNDTNGNYNGFVINVCIYVGLRILSSVFKEMQSVIYVKVKQQASIELQELVFSHLHSLSLNWHVSKKTGGVLKSMDRGIDAVGTLITYLFLYLVPALAECLAVVLLFFIQFSQWELGVAVLSGVLLYIFVTVFITEWRKKYREATNKMDNEYHDKATDSIINFETVKYFTAEKFEVSRYKESVIKFQKYSASTSISLSILNISQQVILNGSLLAALLVAGRAVNNGQLNFGDWIAVQAWVINIFAPLGFLGTVYSSIIQAMVDIRNLSQLLSEQPDVTDKPGAVPIPISTDTHKLKSITVSPHWHFPLFEAFVHHKDATDTNTSLVNGTDETTITFNPVHAPSGVNGSDNNKNLYSQSSQSMSAIDHDSSNLRAPLLMQAADSNTIYTDHSQHTLSTQNTAGIPLHGGNGGVSVEFSQVGFHYPSQDPVKGLKDVSFTIRAGTTTAIVGSTGSGKTTISRLLFRFYDPLEGFISLGGYKINDFTQQSVRACIGVVPQDTVLFNDTILYNIKYGKQSATFEEVEAAAEAAQIKKFIENLPEGWETKVGERGLKLSGGEKQRVAIARCLLKDPPVVLLDEATSALDTVTENSVQEALNTLGAHRTVLIIAHRLSTIRKADQIVVLDAGRIVEFGTHDELLLRGEAGHYARLWNMQVRNHETTGIPDSSLGKFTSNTSIYSGTDTDL